MEKINVLHSCPVWLPKTQTWLYNQIHALPVDIQNNVACLGVQSPAEFPVSDLHSLCGASVHGYKLEALFRKLGIPFYPRWLARVGKRSRIQLLHSHFGNMGWFDRDVAKSLQIPHVVTFYGLDVDHLPQQDARWIARYKQLFDSVDAILCEGSHMAARIIQKGCSATKVRVHHLGVDLKAIPFQQRTLRAGEPLKVLIAGAFREKKGIPYALQALGELQKSVNVEVTVIGDADAEPRNKEEKQKILDVINRYGLNSKLRLLGYCTHAKMFEEAYQHHIFLSPSVHAADGDTEGGAPVSIIEMAASGMPVVSTFHCDIPEVLENGVSGLLAPERNVEALLEHLLWLAQHPDRWQEISTKARAHIEANYDMEKQGERLADVYREMIAAYG